MSHTSKYSLFENNDDRISESDVRSYLDEGRLFLAKEARDKGSYTEALKLLNQVHTAEASYETALVYVSWLLLVWNFSIMAAKAIQCTGGYRYHGKCNAVHCEY